MKIYLFLLVIFLAQNNPLESKYSLMGKEITLTSVNVKLLHDLRRPPLNFFVPG